MPGLVERGWRGPVLDAGVIDRHVDPEREGRRTLADLCGHYGIEMQRPHDAAADAVASIEVLFALAVAPRGAVGVRPGAAARGPDRRGTVTGPQSYDGWRLAQGMVPVDPRDYVWPVAPAVLPPAA